ncbi:MAG: Fur family transcriptional regulator [Desulfobacterales bacterium]
MKQQPWWYRRLKDSGARLTEPREVVLEILRSSQEHLTATDIYVQAHRKKPSIGLTTVYRTLELLIQLGIVQKFELGEGKARFELVDKPGSKGHHHHLVCLKCRKIIDYSDISEDEKEFLSRVEGRLKRKYDFKILDHLMWFYGVCRECRGG